MKKMISLITIFSIVLLIVLSTSTEARQGCCSHHGGVCSYKCPDGSIGHRCCDGTPLSAKCAPYYSTCSDTLPKTSEPKGKLKTIPETKSAPKTQQGE